MNILRVFPLLLMTSNVCADDSVKVNGFGSIVAGAVVDGDGYIAEYPNLGIYEGSSFDFGPESRLGLQFHTNINDKASATTQLVFRGANDFKPEVAWMYLSYQFDNDSTLQAGRLRVPVYHFSEYMDVGYAYSWLRIPADAYSLDLINYNGARYSQDFYFGDFTLNTTALYGHQNNDDDRLMGYLFPNQIDREFKDISGLVLDLDLNDLNLRLSYVQAAMTETRHLPSFLATEVFEIPAQKVSPSVTGLTDGAGNSLVQFDTKYDIYFIDVSAKWPITDVITFFAEFNEYDPFYKSYFTSLSFRHNLMEYYLLYSKFDLNEAWESHDTTSFGVRYDFTTNMALKFDFSLFKDTGFNPFTLEPNPVYKPSRTENGGDGNGNATILSVGIDFVF